MNGRTIYDLDSNEIKKLLDFTYSVFEKSLVELNEYAKKENIDKNSIFLAYINQMSIYYREKVIAKWF